MLVIGLVGGVASGKSFVAECFAELGAQILDADRIGHEVLDRPAVVAEIRSKWPNVAIHDGKIDRKSLAEIVFRSSTHEQQLALLEKITHPLIGQQIDLRLVELRSTDSVAAVLDAPVLFKAGWQSRCDKIVFVETSETVRLARAATRGWSADEVLMREQSQTPLPKKRLLSTDIVNNSSTKLETRNQVQQLWTQWGLDLPAPKSFQHREPRRDIV